MNPCPLRTKSQGVVVVIPPFNIDNPSRLSSLLYFDAHNFMLSTKSLNKDLKSYLVLLNTVFLDISALLASAMIFKNYVTYSLWMCFFVDVSKVSFSVFQLSHLGGYVPSHQPSHLQLVLFKAVQFENKANITFLLVCITLVSYSSFRLIV